MTLLSENLSRRERILQWRRSLRGLQIINFGNGGLLLLLLAGLGREEVPLGRRAHPSQLPVTAHPTSKLGGDLPLRARHGHRILVRLEVEGFITFDGVVGQLGRLQALNFGLESLCVLRGLLPRADDVAHFPHRVR